MGGPDRGIPVHYGEDVLTRISFIRAGQAIGFTLGELQEVITFREHGQAPCAHVTKLLEQKAAEVDMHIAALVQLRETLQGLRDRAVHLDPAECPPKIGVPLDRNLDRPKNSIFVAIVVTATRSLRALPAR